MELQIHNWKWKPKPDYGRLVRTLRRQGDSDHVPFLELFADPEVFAGALGASLIPDDVQIYDRDALRAALDQRIAFWYQLGYDAFWVGPLLDFPELLRLEAQDTAILSRGKRVWVDEKGGAITNWQGFEQYPWPRASDADYFPLEYAARHLPEGMAIIGQVGNGVLETVMWLMGYKSFAVALYDQPDLVEAMFRKVEEIFLPIAQTVTQMERVVAIWLADDMGYKSGPLISPGHLRKYVFPIQKKIAVIAHEHGMPFLLHSCGNLEAVMEDLIEDIQIDSKHSFEDVIQPVEVFFARYGQRISIIGGVDMDLLARGSEGQVRKRTRQILHCCGYSGCYLLGSGNTPANYVPLTNYFAMLDEGQRFNAGLSS